MCASMSVCMFANRCICVHAYISSLFHCYCTNISHMLLNQFGHHIVNMVLTAITLNRHIDQHFCIHVQNPKKCNSYLICYCHLCAIIVFFTSSSKMGYVTAKNLYSHQKWSCDTHDLLIYLPKLAQVM